MIRHCARCRRELHAAEQFSNCDSCRADLSYYHEAWRSKRDDSLCHDCPAPRLADNCRCGLCRERHNKAQREQKRAKRAA